uniref:Uncharacterized protein n=1 Tax=Anguilla anguilla TaxID=7936 RepID=A0A0E9VN81_ANGAN
MRSKSFVHRLDSSEGKPEQDKSD